MRWILDRLFGSQLERHTARYLRELGRMPADASRSYATEALLTLGKSPGPAVPIGTTAWGEIVSVPVGDIVGGHSIVTGATGAGKSWFGLGILESLIAFLPQTRTLGFAVLDPKEELFAGALFLIKRRIDQLGKAEARELRRRVVVLDFSMRDPVSPYNILARWPNADPDFFAGSRADLLLDLLPGGDGLSLGGSALLRKAILLLSEFGLPIGWLDDVLFDEALRGRLLAGSADRELAAYFVRQFPVVPKATIAAVSRRMEALFSSEALRCALSGRSAPDFRALQDEGKIVLINCGGANLSRGVRRLLQALLVSDFCHAVFSRERTDSPFLLLSDEGQNFFITERLRDQMADFLCMARSFGSHTMLLTQNMTAAVQAPRLASVLHTNIRWSFSMRGEPADAAFLKGALPVTGTKRRPRTNPFEEPAFYTLGEERSLAQDGIATLADRTGYLWLKARTKEAFLMRTRDLDLPAARDRDREILPLRADPTFGARQSRKEYDRMADERNREWRGEPGNGMDATLTRAYRRTQGEEP